MYPTATPVRFAGAALLLAAFGSHMAIAQAASHWCSISNEGASNCSFVSVDQCLAAVSGAGGYCMREAQLDDRPSRAADNSTNNANTAKQDHGSQRDVLIDIHICRGC